MPTTIEHFLTHYVLGCTWFTFPAANQDFCIIAGRLFSILNKTFYWCFKREKMYVSALTLTHYHFRTTALMAISVSIISL